MRNSINLLLFLLTIAFFGTALTIYHSVDEEDIFRQDTETLNKNIQKREKIIIDTFSDPEKLKIFENVENYPLQISEISDAYKRQSIYLVFFKDDKPIHWNSNTYIPEERLDVTNESRFLKTKNRSFIVRKIDLEKNISVAATIPIQRKFNSNNEYLEDSFNSQLIKENNIDIADYNDTENIRNIYSYEGNYLFSVKLKPGKKDSVYIDYQVLLIALGIICLFFLAHSLCLLIAQRNKGWLSILCFISLSLSIHFLDLKLNWLHSLSNSFLFSEAYYRYSTLIPNFWSFILFNTALFCIISYVHSIKNYLKIKSIFRQKLYSIPIILLGFISIYFFANLLFVQLSDFITSTSFKDGVFNLLEIDIKRWLNILLFCFIIILVLLYIDWVLYISYSLVENFNITLNVQLVSLILVMVVMYIFEESSLYFNVLLSIIIIIRSLKQYKNRQPQLSSLIMSLLIVSLMSTIALTRSIQGKRHQAMKEKIEILNAEGDENAVVLFEELEKEIKENAYLLKLLQLAAPYEDNENLTRYLKNEFFSGYLSKFEFNGYYYLDDEIPLGKYGQNYLDLYRERVINSSTRVASTENFYKLGSELGTHEYLAQINIPINENEDVQLLLNLKNKSYSTTLPYPEFLMDKSVAIFNTNPYNKTAFAIYKNNQLITQSGDYIYPESNSPFSTDLNKYLLKEGENNYYHLIYNPNETTTIIVSRTHLSIWEFLALISFIFIILYISTTLFNVVNYIVGAVRDQSYRLKNIKYHFFIVRNKIRYSSRIQSLVIGSVITTITISGIIVFFSISKQSENNRTKEKLKNINIISSKIEGNLSLSNDGDSTQIGTALLQLQGVSSKDFNLFDKDGKLIYSSQPKIYENELLSKYMNPKAFEKLNVLKKTETLEQEQVGNFKFDAAYAAIRNNEYKTLAFISYPNYSVVREEAYTNNQLLNVLMNIYTIVIIVFGFLAVFVSKKITEPLNIIQRKLAQTTFLDQENEPLYWERDDEIGTVVKEYNHMLLKLEESSKKLKNIERESAWREMAKQIAHEVKNPLTPMKLGIQQLQRSHRDHDPRFEERFEKISNSFIEQINALSYIATEFSNFARLSETELVKIDLFDKINKSINTFNNIKIASLKVENLSGLNHVYVIGDKNQLLRTFNNLIKNAIEAAIVKKKLSVLFTIDVDSQEEKVIITIADNGIGIPRDMISKIFEPNFTTKSSGTGLGLAFVKNAIESMKGEINFTTAKGKGTTFVIKLPLYNPSEKEEEIS